LDWIPIDGLDYVSVSKTRCFCLGTHASGCTGNLVDVERSVNKRFAVENVLNAGAGGAHPLCERDQKQKAEA
jgi:hypothetical protein